MLIVGTVGTACCAAQPATAVLGEHDQEPRVSVWRSQVTDRRLMSFSCRSDLHGQLLTAGTATGQGTVRSFAIYYNALVSLSAQRCFLVSSFFFVILFVSISCNRLNWLFSLQFLGHVKYFILIDWLTDCVCPKVLTVNRFRFDEHYWLYKVAAVLWRCW